MITAAAWIVTWISVSLGTVAVWAGLCEWAANKKPAPRPVNHPSRPVRCPDTFVVGSNGQLIEVWI